MLKFCPKCVPLNFYYLACVVLQFAHNNVLEDDSIFQFMNALLEYFNKT